ncbi:unnamed protein product [Durusdinium trenchii]|uniref:Uncharacterized protein n=1 Tax=Durusdinium trenchii TaxID=1381693 RepID=A0ABP0LAZ7_9DINO
MDDSWEAWKASKRFLSPTQCRSPWVSSFLCIAGPVHSLCLFLAEPFAVQWLPQHLGQKLVGADKRIKGENAEKALELGEMEQGRYADCIFNVILVVCIPFISPAYLALTFAALIFSHLYLYLYDTVKVLRYVRKFNFSGPEVHWLGMQLFALPVAILAACLLFKALSCSAERTIPERKRHARALPHVSAVEKGPNQNANNAVLRR